jgi:hypothetical protein
MRHVVYIIVLSVSLSIQLVFQFIYGRPFVSFEVYIAGLQCNPFHMLVFSRNFLCHLIDVRFISKLSSWHTLCRNMDKEDVVSYVRAHLGKDFAKE